MANSWFRLFCEFADDPKVQSMAEEHQRRLVMLFCLQCNETLVTLQGFSCNRSKRSKLIGEWRAI